MKILYQFFLIFILSMSIGLAQDCYPTQEYDEIRNDCMKEMSPDDLCFWNCVHKNLQFLDDAGKIVKDKMLASLTRVTNKRLLQGLENGHTLCLTTLDDTMDACEASNAFHKCLWINKDMVDAVAATVCADELDALWKNVGLDNQLQVSPLNSSPTI